MNTNPEPNAKVLFRVMNEDGTSETETLWAFDLGNDKYRLDNLPFYAYGVSWNDVVLAPFDEDEQFPTFLKVVKKSGNRTIRIIFKPAVKAGNRSQALLDELVSLGCEFEAANRTYIVINIPPATDFETVLEKVEAAKVKWEFADPTYEEVNPE